MVPRTLSIGVTALAPLAAACSRDEKASPTPSGPQAQELVLEGAPVLIAVGDIAVCGTQGDEATGALVDSLLLADSSRKVESVVATLGDNAYPSGPQGVTNDFPRCFSPSWGSPRIMRVIHTAPGNHDYDSGSGDPYFTYFGSRAGPAGKGYYSYDVGGWHLISLNSELYFEAGDDAQAKAQEDWLRNDLAQHRTLCALAYFHRPYFTSGRYRTTTQVRPLLEILAAGGVDLVLNGHEHDYERFAPQTAQGVAEKDAEIGEHPGKVRGADDCTAICADHGVLKAAGARGGVDTEAIITIEQRDGGAQQSSREAEPAEAQSSGGDQNNGSGIHILVIALVLL